MGAFTICNGMAFNNNSNNTGSVVDLTSANQGCLNLGERQGTWYYFSPSASGTIGFTITPSAPTDYDFAVWGPMASPSCPPPGPPLRCSYAAPTGDTGCGNGAVDASEGAGGDRWVSTFNVVAGQVFILYVDNFSTNGQSFTLDWQLSNGASLDCTVLPMELLSLTASPRDGTVDLSWRTLSELNSDHFVVERSPDGFDFVPVGTVAAMGNSTSTVDYVFTDAQPTRGMNYYRLRQVDQDALAQLSNTVTALIVHGRNEPMVVPNPLTGSAHVILENAPEEPLSYRVTDAAGRVVQERSLGVPEGVKQFTIAMDEADAGAYFLTIMDEAGLVHGHTRFVKH